MTLFEVFDWLELSAPGTFIRDSVWLFPVIEAGHLLGLSILGGAVRCCWSISDSWASA